MWHWAHETTLSLARKKLCFSLTFGKASFLLAVRKICDSRATKGFILWSFLLFPLTGLQAKLIFNPMRLPSAETEVSPSLDLELRRIASASYEKFLPLKAPSTVIERLIEAEDAFLELKIERARLLWQEAFEQNEKAFPTQDQAQTDQRLQELAWLIWTADPKAVLPESAWRWVEHSPFRERLPQRALRFVDKRNKEKKSVHLKNLPEPAESIRLNFESAQLPLELEPGQHHLILQNDETLKSYEVRVTSDDLSWQELQEHNLWQSPNLQSGLDLLHPPLSVLTTDVKLLRLNAEEKREEILLHRYTPEGISLDAPSHQTSLDESLDYLFAEDLYPEAEFHPMFRSPWFWLGVGALVGTATFVGVQMNQKPVVTTP